MEVPPIFVNKTQLDKRIKTAEKKISNIKNNTPKQSLSVVKVILNGAK
jgi:hypothetical protein